MFVAAASLLRRFFCKHCQPSTRRSLLLYQYRFQLTHDGRTVPYMTGLAALDAALCLLLLQSNTNAYCMFKAGAVSWEQVFA
jgi:hypothetical protein